MSDVAVLYVHTAWSRENVKLWMSLYLIFYVPPQIFFVPLHDINRKGASTPQFTIPGGKGTDRVSIESQALCTILEGVLRILEGIHSILDGVLRILELVHRILDRVRRIGGGM